MMDLMTTGVDSETGPEKDYEVKDTIDWSIAGVEMLKSEAIPIYRELVLGSAWLELRSAFTFCRTGIVERIVSWLEGSWEFFVSGISRTREQAQRLACRRYIFLRTYGIAVNVE